MPSFHTILCTDQKGHIGHRTTNTLLYHTPVDMNRFRALTTPASPNRHAVVMGWKTWASLPEEHRPLADRVNVVLTRNPDHATQARRAGAYPFRSTRDVLTFLTDPDLNPTLYKVFLIGGASVYNDALLQSYVTTVHHTVIDEDASEHHEKDELVCVCLRALQHQFDVIEEISMMTECQPTKGGLPGSTAASPHKRVIFRTLHREAPGRAAPPLPPPTSGEHQYLQLLRRLLRAPPRETRNSVTLSLFGERVVVDLSDGTVPLLTTKRVAWKTVIRELLWFVRGDTDNQKLNDEKVHIWDANASRAFLDSRGLTERPENDLGPVYGFQWRHFGAEYTDCHADYTGRGVDQLELARKQIQTTPTSRRILFTAWNPTDLDQMALPPCHLLGQWYVTHDGKLWLQVYQRSGDMFLGVPFNLFSYSVLIHMMAHLTNKQVGGLTYVLGDAHIYKDHVDVVMEQLQRKPHAPPHFRVKHDCTTNRWEDFTLDSFELLDYTHESSLQAKMVA